MSTRQQTVQAVPEGLSNLLKALSGQDADKILTGERAQQMQLRVGKVNIASFAGLLEEHCKSNARLGVSMWNAILLFSTVMGDCPKRVGTHNSPNDKLVTKAKESMDIDQDSAHHFVCELLYHVEAVTGDKRIDLLSQILNFIQLTKQQSGTCTKYKGHAVLTFPDAQDSFLNCYIKGIGMLETKLEEVSKGVGSDQDFASTILNVSVMHRDLTRIMFVNVAYKDTIEKTLDKLRCNVEKTLYIKPKNSSKAEPVAVYQRFGNSVLYDQQTRFVTAHDKMESLA